MMKILLAILALASIAGAINWDYPEDLALDCKEGLEEFLNAYENACIDSIDVGGVMFPIPSTIRDYWRNVAAAERAEFMTAWTALNDYILGR